MVWALVISGFLILVAIILGLLGYGGKGYKVIKDIDHPTRVLCRQAIATRIGNYQDVRASYEDVLYFGDHYEVTWFAENMKQADNLSREKTRKLYSDDIKCFSESESVCKLNTGAGFECIIPSDKEGNITGPVKLKLAGE